LRVLVIDDNGEINEVLKVYCESRGIECTTINDGKKGLKTILEDTFDLILLDLAMPEFSGIDVVASLKKADVLSTKNVVIFTASSDPKIIEEMKNIGVKEILKKPISIDELTSFIDRYNPDI
jgi:DNA-binding response OmpR family regulator